jgi:hypothetical protein
MAKIRLMGRIAFAQGVWTAQKVKGDSAGKPAFSATLLLDLKDPQIKLLNDAIEETAKEKWGAKAKAELELMRKKDRTCLHDGDLKPDYEGFPGMMFVSARNPIRPLVLNTDRSPLAEEDGVVYSGCYVNMVLELWAQDNDYGKRVNATLSGVQFVKDGDSFGGGGRVADVDDFEDVSAGGEDDLS